MENMIFMLHNKRIITEIDKHVLNDLINSNLRTAFFQQIFHKLHEN